MKNVKRITAGLLMLAMGISVAGCGEKKEVNNSKLDIEPIDFTQYKDSEEVPSWEGEKLSLIKWEQASNTSSKTNKSKIVTDDPISKELERITGITYSVDESFDNSGNSYDAVVAKLIAADDFPHMVENLPDPSSLIKSEYLWDLEPYLEKYAPTLYKLFGPESKTLYGDLWEYQKETYGGIYEISIPNWDLNTGANSLTALKEIDGSIDMTSEQIRGIADTDISAYPYFYMRDDILKQLYPQAHTVAELKEIFNKNGKFTEEEIFDVPINSSEDFLDMLYKIKDLKLKDGNADVYPMFTHVGSDNWPILVQLGGMFGYATATPGENPNYFSYWDMKEGKILPTFKQPWFKDILKMYNKLIRDEVSSPEALVDTKQLFDEKLNNGRYIVCYGQYFPSEANLGGKYAYRKVYCNYTSADESKYLFAQYDYTQFNRYSFFNSSVSEEQLVQILQMFEFVASNAGQKLMFWGPKSEGWYTENEDGTLSYNDENVKKEMLFEAEEGTETIEPMGLAVTWPGKVKIGTTKYVPKAMYCDEMKTWESEFNAARIKKQELVPSNVPNVYNRKVLETIPEMKRFWDARNGFEDSLLKVFAAQDDEEFEKLYNTMVKYAEDNGLTDETFTEFNNYYKNDLNKDYMHYIEEKKKEVSGN